MLPATACCCCLLLPVCLPACLPGCLVACLSACLPSCLPACLLVCPSVCLVQGWLSLPACLRLPASMYVCPLACPPACLPAGLCLSVCLWPCLPAYACVCLPQPACQHECVSVGHRSACQAPTVRRPAEPHPKGCGTNLIGTPNKWAPYLIPIKVDYP